MLAPIASGQLVNPGFEQAGGSLQGWTRFNNVVPNVVASNDTPRSGAACAKTFGGFNGNPNWSGLFQNLPAFGGQMWQANAHARHNAGDALTGTPNRVWMKVEFYRVAGGSYGSADMLYETQLEILSGASPTDTWTANTLSAFAPAETVEARIVFVFEQAASAAGAALLDDVSFEPVNSPPNVDWQLIWSDEFDGTAIDDAKWRVEDLHLIKNNELQYYAPDDVYVAGGNLTLRSRQRSYWGYDSAGNWRHFNYTSGLVESKDRFAAAYGRIEVRGKLPATQGIWPAHWMLPDSREWPPEIDIMELLGHEPTRVYMTHHWGSWPNVERDGGSYSGPDYSAGFHEFAVEWTPTRLDWEVDGVLRFSSTRNVPREPFYIILNTAVGGDWPGNPDPSTVFPQHHEIDYVRVYTLADPGPPLQTLIDGTQTTATADGQIAAGEYATSLRGINAGLLDRIGRDSVLHVDSAADGRLNLAFDSVTAWSPASPYGVVLYADSVEGGFASTYEFADDSSRALRLVSGKGSAGQRSDLYFAPGFRADFAIALEPNYVTIYRLDAAGHAVINGAALGANTDMFGGTDVRYVVDDGASGGRVRECELRLAHLGLAPGESLRFIATLMNGDSAFRANEFIGVAEGNDWDGTNPGANPVVLKLGDFAAFSSVQPSTGCGPGCSTGAGDADLNGDCDVNLDDLAVLLSHFGTTSGATHGQGDTDFDGDVELDDLSLLLSLYGATCP